MAALAAAALAIGIPPALATGEREVEMDDFAFAPARLTVKPGALVTWKNRDRAPHNAIAFKQRNGKPVFQTKVINYRGVATAHAPRIRGTYRYFCAIHPSMRGTLVVK
jgi:plastocyanin